MSDFDALRQKAKDKAAASDRPTWKPTKAGEELAGYLREVEYRFTLHGEGYTVVLEDEDGESYLVWCTGTVLANQMLDSAPGIGAPLVITFNGKKKNKAGTFEYNDFTVAANPEDMDFDVWRSARELAYEKKKIKEQEAIEEMRTRNATPADDLASPF